MFLIWINNCKEDYLTFYWTDNYNKIDKADTTITKRGKGRESFEGLKIILNYQIPICVQELELLSEAVQMQ